ncbi:MAG: protein kinase, partial [Anaerolineae bacterium]|nr:protein kinase [Anaerolineae bacterium]
MAEELIGKSIRGYTIEERIGSGGYGVVYRAFQPSVDREVAIKVVLPERAKSDYFVKQFDEEAHLVAKLEHPFIVPLYDYWQDEDQACLVMRWLHGGSLRDTLIREAIGEEAVVQMVDQIGAALKLAHSHGVVHRDIKPDNILLDENGNYFLTDFGIAKDLKGEVSSITSIGMVTGTPAYLSPEQGMAKGVTSRSDIYSLGVVLYEVLTGVHPFPEADPTTQILHHISDPLPSVSEKRPDLSRDIDEVIQTATAKEPEDRYETMDEFVADFKAASGAGEVKARKAVPGILEKKLGVKAHVPTFLKEEAGEEKKEVFVGREGQLTTLEAFSEKAIAGDGQLVFITGEAGRGKSALMEEFGRRATDKHNELIIAMGKCKAFTGAGDPYLPFREVLGMLTGDVESSLASRKITREQAFRLWHLLPETCGELTAGGIDLIGTLVSKRELAERAAGYESDGAAWQTQLAKALANTGPLSELREVGQAEIHQEYLRVLKAIARKHPLMICIDDLHW